MSVFRSALISMTAAACFVVLAMAPYAAAQGVTGTVSGTVKDAQGGVVPGATVTLISETRGTRHRRRSSPTNPAISSSRTSPPTPTPSRSKCRRSERCGDLEVAVSAGSRVELGSLTHRSRRHQRSGDRHQRGAARSGGERRAVVHGRHRVGGRTCRSPNRSYDALLALAPGVEQPAWQADACDAAGRRRRRQLHARRRDGDGPRRQSSGHARQRRSRSPKSGS